MCYLEIFNKMFIFIVKRIKCTLRNNCYNLLIWNSNMQFFTTDDSSLSIILSFQCVKNACIKRRDGRFHIDSQIFLISWKFLSFFKVRLVETLYINCYILCLYLSLLHQLLNLFFPFIVGFCCFYCIRLSKFFGKIWKFETVRQIFIFFHLIKLLNNLIFIISAVKDIDSVFFASYHHFFKVYFTVFYSIHFFF